MAWSPLLIASPSAVNPGRHKTVYTVKPAAQHTW
jgi:hypothetical protein